MANPKTGLHEEVRTILHASPVAMTSRDIFNASQLATSIVQVSSILSGDYADGLLAREALAANIYAYKFKGGVALPKPRQRHVEAPKPVAVVKPSGPMRVRQQKPPKAEAAVAAETAAVAVVTADEEVAAAVAEGKASMNKVARFAELPLVLHQILRALGERQEPMFLSELSAATGLNRGSLIFDLQALEAARMVVRTVGHSGRYCYGLVAPVSAELSSTLPVNDALSGSLLIAASKADQALIAYSEQKADPVLSALISAAQHNWRSCALAGVSL